VAPLLNQDVVTELREVGQQLRADAVRCSFAAWAVTSEALDAAGE
jgi:hypothetical protein